MSKDNESKERKMKLIVCDDEHPVVPLRAGMRFEVVSVPLVDPTLKKSQPIAGRLCGGTSTCLALVEIGQEAVINPV
jgi:hypothetical protein